MIDLDDVEREGYALVPGLLDEDEVESLIQALSSLHPGSALSRVGRIYASRNLLRDVPDVRRVASSAATLQLVRGVLGPGAFAVRGLLFDKTAEANWMVPWHQDLTIAVKRRMDVPGFGPWTMKGGVPHVRPPIDVLNRMLTVRVHLDDCGEGHGPLRVVPGSHRDGRLDADSTRRWLDRVPAVACPVPRGGALVMRPLLLHASSRSDAIGRRRVVHLEYAADPLPHGLEWSEAPDLQAVVTEVYPQ